MKDERNWEEYQALRAEIAGLSAQRVTIQATLFTIAVAIVTAGVALAYSDQHAGIAGAWVCLCAYIVVVAMLAVVSRKKRAVLRCGAYLFVNYELSEQSKKKIMDSPLQPQEVCRITSESWEIAYRYAADNYWGNLNGAPRKNGFSAVARFRRLASELVGAVPALILSVMVLIGVVLCAASPTEACGVEHCVEATIIVLLSAVPLLVNVALLVIGRFRARSGQLDNRISAEPVAFQNLYSISRNLDFARYAEEFLDVRPNVS